MTSRGVMLSPARRRRGFAPSAPNVSVNHGHPMAAGLIACFVGGRALNVHGGTQVNGGDITAAPTPFGPGVRSADPDSRDYRVNVTTRIGSSQRFSIAFAGSADAGMVAFDSAINLRSSQFWGLSMAGESGGVYTLGLYEGPGFRDASLLVPVGSAIRWQGSIAYDGSYLHTCNGLRAGGTGAAPVAHSGTTMATFGRDTGAGGRGWQGSIAIAAVWGRERATGEHATWEADPFCFLRW